jgi:hypothetical protein
MNNHYKSARDFCHCYIKQLARWLTVNYIVLRVCCVRKLACTEESLIEKVANISTTHATVAMTRPCLQAVVMAMFAWVVEILATLSMRDESVHASQYAEHAQHNNAQHRGPSSRSTAVTVGATHAQHNSSAAI